MSIRQSDVRFDEFKQTLTYVDHRAPQLVPRCCGENALRFWQEDTTFHGELLRDGYDGRRLADDCGARKAS